VAAPEEDMLVFDVEVLYKESPFAIMACAASPTAWYAWLSPWLLGEKESSMCHLVPLGDPEKPRIVVGHNIGYDRARVAEEYNIKQTNTAFLDTMSLHVAVNGMCSRQRPTWLRHAKNRQLREKLKAETESPELINLLSHSEYMEEEEELWVGRSSINSLREVARFHCDASIDKAMRDQFGVFGHDEVVQNLGELLDYCSVDVMIAHEVYKKTFPHFRETCPHPVSFGALRHLSSVTLPVNKSWEEYIQKAEATYQNLLDGVLQRLKDLAEHAVKFKDQPDTYTNDLWLQQLDWSGQETRMTKETKTKPSRPAARQKMPGKPRWYKDLFPKVGGPINLTVRTRIAPMLLKMAWDGNPIIWSSKHGWVIRIERGKDSKYEDSPVVKVTMEEEKNPQLRDDLDGVYFKLPHKDGPAARCVAPLAKGYLKYFEAGVLTSEYGLAKEALQMNAACSYWISARERIKNQMVVYEDQGVDIGMKADPDKKERPLGIILPQVIPMGTITRRAVESTWLTASNAKKNRVGSELKALVTAPPGYVFVGADVDSEELWIASLVGDAQFKLHGGNALGFMTLEGSKAAGTDLHSKTAKILDIVRNNAKVFNYGRIYGAGLKFAATLLRQFNPVISDSEAENIAKKLYRETKGTKSKKQSISPRPFWYGGTESFVFNKLEEFAEQDQPRTPVLGAGITEALMKQYINKGGFLTSRINWAIQSSGVDYLHLLIISMDYLIRRYGLNARLAITVHDEIRYLVKSEDKYRVAMALQVANIWTRCMFAQQMGIEDLPQSCAWFSAVDIDRVLRKEVDLDCVTPSQPDPIPPGESLDIQSLLSHGGDAALDPREGDMTIDTKLESIHYEHRQPVMESLIEDLEGKNLFMIRAQIARTEEELKKVMKEYNAFAGTRNKGKKDDRQTYAPKNTPRMKVQRVNVSPKWNSIWTPAIDEASMAKMMNMEDRPRKPSMSSANKNTPGLGTLSARHLQHSE
jgi:DNA polymerase gamma 1